MVASVETRVETQETFHWTKKRCNVLRAAYVVATADFCYPFYFMIKLSTQVRNLVVTIDYPYELNSLA